MEPTELDLVTQVASQTPLIAALLDKLRIREVIDNLLPKHCLAKVSDAACVEAMILGVLCDRVALWRIDESLEHLDLELIFGKDVEASHFNDTRLGLALDHIDAAGCDNILSGIVLKYLADKSADPISVHLDHTSVSLYGNYRGAPEPTPRHGFSKDHRPDLKQLVFGMSVHGSSGIPLTAGFADGNTSDHAGNRDHLRRLATLLPGSQVVTIVADCKLVDASTLKLLFDSGFHFVSLIPDSYKLRSEMVARAWGKCTKASDWPILAQKPGDKASDPPSSYRGMSFEGDFSLPSEKQGESEFRTLRCLVVHSDSLAGGFEANLPAKLKREADSVISRLNPILSRGFACQEDAMRTTLQMVKKLTYHRCEISIAKVELPLKGNRPGRRKKTDPTPEAEVVWTPSVQLIPDEEAIQKERSQASCFVLVSDWDEEQWSDEKVLAEYRHQSLIEGHTGFRWLKGPAAVAPIMLENTNRIRAMGLVMMLALMVRNYLQYRLREEMVQRKSAILHPIRKKEEPKLTTEMALVWFNGIITVQLRLPDGRLRRLAPTLRPEAVKILDMLGLSPKIYAQPRIT
jgi:transposase